MAAGLLTLGSNRLYFGWTSGGGNGVVNLSGGTISTHQVLKNSGTATFNFNGGVLQAAPGTSGTNAAAFLTGLNNAYVYPGGAVINTNSQNITIGQALLAPTGSGVTSITATGSGFVGAPIVSITGGSGSGATASAIFNPSSGTVSVQITNPGVGYTLPPTVTFTGGGGTMAGTTAAIGPNASSGGLTKQDSGMLTLTAANTYGGPTQITAGTLQVGNGGSGASIGNTSGVSLANSAVIAFNHADNVTFTPNITGTGGLFQSGGTLTLTASNNYTGGTVVNQGLLATSAAGNLAPTSRATTSRSMRAESWPWGPRRPSATTRRSPCSAAPRPWAASASPTTTPR